jgi:moderate conductance mechanosensitive channel
MNLSAMRSLRYLLIPVIVALVCASGAIARAQVTSGLVPAAAPSHQALFASAPIMVDGVAILRITALASPPPDAMPLTSRVFLIDSAIAQILSTVPGRDETVYDPGTLKISVKQEDSEYALVATDKHHSSAFPILTVTADDARRNGVTPAELAQQWQPILQNALYVALERRQPAEISRGTTTLVYTAIALAVLTLIGLLLFRFLRNRAIAAIVMWIIALLWLAAITYGLLLFPQTVKYGNTIVGGAIRIALVCAAAFIVERLFVLIIHQGVRGWALIGVPPGQQARYLLRVPTMSKALSGFTRFVIIFVAILAMLSALNIPIASVVTIGGIAALAIGFAAQSLVRDFVNGILVLFEDQYVVGDYIMIGDFNGTVEHLSLRIVQIRDTRGNLITIPHSSVSQVVNASRNWSRVDYRISIDAQADLRKAIDVLRATLEAMKEDDSWRDTITEPLEWIGIEAMSRNGVVLRAVVRTAPLRQFEVRREINLRVYEALAKAGVALGNDPSAPFVTPPQASPDPT